jgi:hypothetical protein
MGNKVDNFNIIFNAFDHEIRLCMTTMAVHKKNPRFASYLGFW